MNVHHPWPTSSLFRDHFEEDPHHLIPRLLEPFHGFAGSSATRILSADVVLIDEKPQFGGLDFPQFSKVFGAANGKRTLCQPIKLYTTN